MTHDKTLNDKPCHGSHPDTRASTECGASRRGAKKLPHKERLKGIFFHLTFLVKHREPLLTQEMLILVEKTFSETLQRANCHLVEFLGEADQVHLLIELDPERIISDLIGTLKGRSSKILRLEYPYLKEAIEGKGTAFWHGSYFLATVNGVNLPRLDKSFADPYLSSQLGKKNSQISKEGFINAELKATYSKVYTRQQNYLTQRLSSQGAQIQYTQKIAQLIKTRREQNEAKRSKYLESELPDPGKNIDRKMSFHFEGRTSTKLLLMLVSQFYKINQQSKIIEDILLPRLIKLLENVDFDWIDFLQTNDLYTPEVHDRFDSRKNE